MYIFKHIAMVNEDFICVFTSLATLLLSVYLTGLVALCGLHRGPLWIKCAACPGPADKQPMPKAYKYIGVVPILLQVLLSTRIWWHKRKMANAIEFVGVVGSLQNQGPNIVKVPIRLGNYVYWDLSKIYLSNRTASSISRRA